MANHEQQTEVPSTSTATAPSATATTETALPPSPRARAETSPASNPATGEIPITDLEKFKIKCLANAIYHEDRERFFATIHRLTMFVVVASGTAALSPYTHTYPLLFPAITTLAGLIDLVFDVSGKARLHAGLRKQIFNVLADADGSGDINASERRLTLIYADEPPSMYAVNAIAYNNAMASYGRPRKYFMKIGFFSRLFRNWLPYGANYFKSYEELGVM